MRRPEYATLRNTSQSGEKLASTRCEKMAQARKVLAGVLSRPRRGLVRRADYAAQSSECDTPGVQSAADATPSRVPKRQLSNGTLVMAHAALKKSPLRRTEFRKAHQAAYVIQVLRAKINFFRFSENHALFHAILRRCGAYRDRHETWSGMRWTLMCLLTSGTDADGEVAWSWRPKGSASSSSEAERLREGRRWQSARFTEESAYKP